MAGTIPPIFTITNDDHGGYVAVVAYTLLTFTVMIVATRLSTRWYIGRLIQHDDMLLTFAALLAILQTAFTQLAIGHGLGKKRAILASRDFNLYQKYEYSAQILLIATVACSKVSLSLLFKNLMTQGWILRAAQGLMAAIVGWALSSILAMAFQCSLPHPWDFTGHCVNQNALFNYIAALNIITDLGLIVLPCIVLWNVQVPRSKRLKIMAMLATRLVVCVAVGFQIHSINSLLKSSDRTWANIQSAIWDQTMMNMSIIATAIPSLGRLAVELQPTVNAFAITGQHGLRSGDKYVLSSIATRYPRDFAVENRLGTHTSVQGSNNGWQSPNRGDSESTHELVKDGIQQNVIQQTINFEIH